MFPKKLRAILVPALLLFLLSLSLILLLNSLIQNPSVQRYLLRELSKATKYELSTGRIEISLWDGIGVSAHNLKARSRVGSESIVASRVKVRLDAGELIKGRIVPTRIFLIRPLIEFAFKKGLAPSKPGQMSEIKAMLLRRLAGFPSVSMEDARVRLKDVPFEFENLYLNVSQVKGDPQRLRVSLRGRVLFEKEKIPFTLRGTIGQDEKGQNGPLAEVTIKTGKIPLVLIPSIASLPVKDGQAAVHLRLKGSLDGPLSADGEIIAEGFHFSLVRADKKKVFSLPRLALEFKSLYSERALQVSSLSLNATDFSLSASSKIDLQDTSNPHLLLRVTSPYMPLKIFKTIFPTPLLPQWIENRLSPILTGGDVRVDLFSLHGTLEQIRHLGRPKNVQTLSMQLAWKDLGVLTDESVLPFKGITGELNIDSGSLLVSKVKAGFGQSIVRDGALHISSLYNDSTKYNVSIDGLFDLQDLMLQREADLIPLDVRQKLKEFESVSGTMEARVQTHYESGWDTAKILNSDFRFSDCSIIHKELLMPLALDEAHIQINGQGKGKFLGTGLWGNSEIKVSGSLGKAWEIGKASIAGRGDLNQVISHFFKNNQLPVKFGDLVPCRVNVSRQKGHWSFQGEVGLDGVTLETPAFSINPPGRRDKVAFNVNLIPQEKLYLNECSFLMGDSSLRVSGSYDLRDGDSFDVKVSTESLSLEDFGVRFKKGDTLAKGTFTCKLDAHTSLRDPLMTSITGDIEAQNLSFILDRLPSPISDCNLKVVFSGKETHVHSLKMKVGQSPIRIQGRLKGWGGLKGELTINSDYLNTSDFAAKGTQFFSGSRKSDPHRFARQTDISVKLKAVRAQWQTFRCGPLEAEGSFRSGGFHINRSRLQMEHGFLKVKGHVKNGQKPDISFSSYIRMTKQPVKDLLECIAPEKFHLEGLLTTEAVLFAKSEEMKGLVSGLTGNINILVENGNVRKSRVIFNILQFLSLQKIFKRKPPDVSKEGFYFESIGGHITVNNGVLEAENLRMESPVFNAAANGTGDLTKNRVDVDLGVQPLGTIDWIVSKVPIVGYILTGKGKSLLIYYFKVNGPLTEPEVKYIPLKNLGGSTVGFFKRLFLTPVRLFKSLGGIAKKVGNGTVPLTDEELAEEELRIRR